MGKGTRSSSARHQQFRDRAKNRVDDLQEIFSGLQSARKESRAADAAVLEEQVHQMLREWRSELNEPSPASSLLGNQRESDPPSETLRLLQLREEEDDATSKLVEVPPLASPHAAMAASNQNQNLKPEPQAEETAAAPHAAAAVAPGGGGVQGDVTTAAFHDQTYYMNQELTVDDFLYDDDCKISFPGSNLDVLNHRGGTSQLEFQQFNLQQELPHNLYLDINNCEQNGGDVFFHMSDLLTTMCPPPSAFLRPKCALWDCPRPAQGSDRCHDYCSIYHADLALKEEGPLGTTPVIRPRGIDLKDGPLFSALGAKIQGKNVGIPVCEGAATAKSPWNAPELFDLCVLEGESIREWLFFDKPRRAFESGNRKQRSLPDYSGRGWHESRKQVMKEFGGLKRSYYMDPQPLSNYEWHLYEYEINDCDTFALYRLEFKSSDAKKSAKAKLATNSLVDLQQQMVRLSADSPVENKRNARSRAKTNQKDSTSNICPASNTTNQGTVPNNYQVLPEMDHMTFLNGSPVYGPSLPYGYSTERSDFYWNISEET